MKATEPEDKLEVCPYSWRPGKKYIFGLVAIKLIVIYVVYMQTKDLSALVHSTVTSHVRKDINITLYNVSLFHIPLTDETDMLPYYVGVAPDVWCFVSGINIQASKSQKHCMCLKQWHGLDCGIPEAIWKSSYIKQGENQGVQIKRRKVPRRIIWSVLFTKNYDLLEIIVRYTSDVTDVYLVSDEVSNPDSSLITMLKLGFLKKYQNKIMPISIEKKENFTAVIDYISFSFDTLWQEGRKHVSDFRPDDIFLFSHTSSIIAKDILLFLKLYDGYPEPFDFFLRPLLYQFRRVITENYPNHKTLFLPLGCTFQYLDFLCDNNLTKLIQNDCITTVKDKDHFEKTFWHLEDWHIGNQDSPSGWQCNWCNKGQNITDFLIKHEWLPKLLNISVLLPTNSNVSLPIDSIIKEGRWLDGSMTETTILLDSDAFFAPEVVMDNTSKYFYLIH